MKKIGQFQVDEYYTVTRPGAALTQFSMTARPGYPTQYEHKRIPLKRGDTLRFVGTGGQGFGGNLKFYSPDYKVTGVFAAPVGRRVTDFLQSANLLRYKSAATLRGKIIRLAYEQPDLRPELLPLLKEAYETIMMSALNRNLIQQLKKSLDKPKNKTRLNNMGMAGPHALLAHFSKIITNLLPRHNPTDEAMQKAIDSTYFILTQMAGNLREPTIKNVILTYRVRDPKDQMIVREFLSDIADDLAGVLKPQTSKKMAAKVAAQQMPIFVRTNEGKIQITAIDDDLEYGVRTLDGQITTNVGKTAQFSVSMHKGKLYSPVVYSGDMSKQEVGRFLVAHINDIKRHV